MDWNSAVPPRTYDSSSPRTLRDLWSYRELLARLVERDLKVKYQRSALGFVWTLFNPLLTVGILVTVFSYVVRIDVPHYWAFLLSGYFVFNFALQMLNTGSTVLREHSQLMKSAAFPGEIPLVAAGIARLVEFGVAMALVLVVLAVFHHGTVPPSFLFLPLLLVLQVVLVLGIAMPLAILSVFFYDVEHALPVLVMMLFYISPVFYPVSMVPEQFQQAYFLNPLAGILTLFHIVLYEGQAPPLGLVVWVTAVAGALYGIGYAVFKRNQAVCIEIV